MENDPIQLRCQAMSDHDLILALTRHKEQNIPTFLTAATAELRHRGQTLESFFDRVEISLNWQTTLVGTVADALHRIQQDIPLWNTLFITHAMGETLAWQKETSHWSVHHFTDASYQGSYFINPDKTLPLLTSFLHLETWETAAPQPQNLNQWHELERDQNPAPLQPLAVKLDAAAVPYTVRSPAFSPANAGPWSLLVPQAHKTDAANALKARDAEVLALYRQAEALADSGSLDQELAIYQQLVNADRQNPAVFYNLGAILFEQAHYPQAAQAFGETVSLALARMQVEQPLSGRGGGIGGGLMGNVLKQMLPGKPDKDETTRGYPDYIDDTQLFLQQLALKEPEDPKILHSLALIAQIKNTENAVDSALQYYQKILQLNPTDSVARANLDRLEND